MSFCISSSVSKLQDTVQWLNTPILTTHYVPTHNHLVYNIHYKDSHYKILSLVRTFKKDKCTQPKMIAVEKKEKNW